MSMVSKLLSSVPPLFADLAKVISGDIDCSHQSLAAYSIDGSPYSVRPQAVIYPKHATDIKHILSFAREYNMPITVRGNGTSRSGGSLGEGIILSLSRYFTKIKQINMMEHTITVDAGVSVKALREKLHGWHMDIPLLTAQDNEATIGGLVSTKNSTPTSFHHGTIREWIESITVVVDTGEEHRIADGITPSGRLLGIYQSIFPILTKNGPILRAAKPETNDDATGYCLWNTSIGPRQFIDELVGSEGTLGIITSVTLRLTPHKKHATTVCIPIDDTKILNSCINIAKHHSAEHIFIYDTTFSKLTEKYHANLLPEIKESSYVLLVTHYSYDLEKLHASVRSFKKALPVEESAMVETNDVSLIERITNRSFYLSLLDSYTQGAHVSVTIADGIIVSIQNYTILLELLDTYLSSLGNLYLITGNAGSGHISVIMTFDPASPKYELDIGEYTKEIFSLVKKYKGGISALSGEGLSRTPYLSYVYNEETLLVFKKIKDAWDARNLFNPSKKLSVTTQYLHEHIAPRNLS